MLILMQTPKFGNAKVSKTSYYAKLGILIYPAEIFAASCIGISDDLIP